jgi:hypothetical protein
MNVASGWVKFTVDPAMPALFTVSSYPAAAKSTNQ